MPETDNNPTESRQKEDKNQVGRPPKYRSAKQLQKKIDQYFNDPPRYKEVVVGVGAAKKVVRLPYFTITGLVLFLGFCDRCSFYEMEAKKEFTHTIKRARTRIEEEYEMLLQDGNKCAQYALSNLGKPAASQRVWTNQTEIT